MNQNNGNVVNGDGNVIGNNNKVLVDKRTINRITHQAPKNSGGGGGGQGGGSDASTGFSIVLAVLVAVAIACWKFATYADEIYAVLLLVSMAAASAQLISVIYGAMERVGGTWTVERLFGLASSIFLLLAVYWGRSAFPQELTTLARGSQGGPTFLCSLSEYGRQIVSLHTVSAGLLAAPAAVLLVLNAMAALSGIVCFTTGWTWSARLAIAMGRRSALAIALVLSVIAAWSQTSGGWSFWQEKAWTEQHDPFTKHSVLCKKA